LRRFDAVGERDVGEAMSHVGVLVGIGVVSGSDPLGSEPATQ